jgi:hypothetical protein
VCAALLSFLDWLTNGIRCQKRADSHFLAIPHTWQTKQGSASHVKGERDYYCPHTTCVFCEFHKRVAPSEARRLTLSGHTTYMANEAGIGEPYRKRARSLCMMKRLHFLIDSQAVFTSVSASIPALFLHPIQGTQNRDLRLTLLLSRATVITKCEIAPAVLNRFESCLQQCERVDPCFISILHTRQTMQGSPSDSYNKQNPY